MSSANGAFVVHGVRNKLERVPNLCLQIFTPYIDHRSRKGRVIVRKAIAEDREAGEKLQRIRGHFYDFNH